MLYPLLMLSCLIVTVIINILHVFSFALEVGWIDGKRKRAVGVLTRFSFLTLGQRPS